jgi:hypothetical protein
VKRIIPAYTWHGQLLTRLAAENLKQGDRVILNPSNGPMPDDETERLNIQNAMRFVRDRKGISLGYVHLSYGARPIGDVIADIVSWRAQGISPIFFDETPASWGSIDIMFMVALTSSKSVFNPGTPLTGATAAMPPGVVVITHESGEAPARKPQPWEAALVHSGGASLEQLAANGWKWGYTTTDTLPNPWDAQ